VGAFIVSFLRKLGPNPIAAASFGDLTHHTLPDCLPVLAIVALAEQPAFGELPTILFGFGDVIDDGASTGEKP
jgi:hypothetical protein